MRAGKEESGFLPKQKFRNVPGVVYPTHHETKLGHCPETGKPYTVPPRWGITTHQAAEMLQSGASAARVMLKKNKVPFHMVSIDGASPQHYWKKDRVARLCETRPPLCTEVPNEQLLTGNEVVEEVGLARSTVMRAVKAGELPVVKLRLHTEQGPQKRCFFRLSEVHKWLNQRRAQTKRAEQGQHDAPSQ